MVYAEHEALVWASEQVSERLLNEQFVKLLPTRFGHSIFRIPMKSNKIYSKLFANDNDSLDMET